MYQACLCCQSFAQNKTGNSFAPSSWSASVMRLVGVEVSSNTVKVVSGVALGLAAVAALVDSYTTGILVLTSFCFGAGVFSLILDLCPENQLPNFLASHTLTKLHSLDCNLDKNPGEPWKDLEIPVEIDQALTDLYEHILREYVYSWYTQISMDEDFVHEIRHALRHASALLVKRLGKLELATLITQKAIPIGLSHADSFLHAKQYAEAFQTDLTESYFDFVGEDVHPAALNREQEVIYVQEVTKKLLPLLVPKKTLQSGVVATLLSDVISGAVLQPVMDVLADPDIINFILEVAFDEEPARTFPKASGRKVTFLEKFETTYNKKTASALHMDLSAILKNQQALFAFMQFLKEEGAINQLQFCLSIEDFNKRMLTPELSASEKKALHAEALDLYKLYLKPSASHKVTVPKALVDEIYKILSGPTVDVVQLRTTTPMFKAYEEVYTNLEGLCPAFYKSEQYFTFLLGRRSNETPDTASKHRNKKPWLKKRLHFKKRSKDSSESSGSSIFYHYSQAGTNGGNLFFARSHSRQQQQLLLAAPNEMKKYPSDIDLARASALTSLGNPKRKKSKEHSKSLEDLTSPEAQTPSFLDLQSPPSNAARSNSLTGEDPIAPSDLRFLRNLSIAATKSLNEEDSAKPSRRQRLKAKAATLPANLSSSHAALYNHSSHPLASMSRHLKMSTPMLAKSVKSMVLHKKKSPRSQTDPSGKTTDKIGKGLNKLKHGVLGRSMEGMVDPLDPALDIADIYAGDKDDSMSSCSGSLGDILEYRDLSAWRVSIPRLATGHDSNGRPCFVFVVAVQRIDVTSQKANGEDLQWEVSRRYSEFYNLEDKLTEFHGEFEDASLPVAKSKLFTGRGLDVMQSKKQPFENYLKCLLQKPALKRSDILFTFLTSTEEFTAAATSHLALGKMIKNVPMKLTKERGQGLQPFISAFFASTQPDPPKPRYDYVVSAEYDPTMERPIPKHPLFQDNLSVTHLKPGHCNRYFKDLKPCRESGVFDTLVYLLVNFFGAGDGHVRFLLGARLLLRNTFDALVDAVIASKLAEVLCVRRAVHVCGLLEEVVFGPSEHRTDEDKEERKGKALGNFQDFLRPIFAYARLEEGKFEEGTELVFSALQNPVINKQIAFVLLDTALGELFPELNETN